MEVFKTAEFKQLLKSLEQRPFNMFNAIDELVGENAISRIISFFLTSDNNHGYESDFVLAVYNELEKLKHMPKLSTLEISNDFKLEVSSKFNWKTKKKRLVDILVTAKVNDKTVFAIGFETKIWALEQPDQVIDYQKSITEEFDCPSALIFLTPTGRESSTYSHQLRCKISPWSYSKLAKIILELGKKERPASTFFTEFGVYMKKGFVSTVSDEDIKSIRKIWTAHADSLKKIIAYGDRVKNPRYFITEVLPRELSSPDLSEIAYISWVYPRTMAIPYEYNFVLNNVAKLLKKKNYKFQIVYMVYNPARKPEEDPRWSVKLMLYYADTTKDIGKKFAKVYSQVSGIPLSSNAQQWSPWICLEDKPGLNFGNFSGRKGVEVAKVIRDFERKTFPTLIKAIEQFSP